jgi:SAM-dependent methyltransferase
VTDAALFHGWTRDAAAPFEGWDFSYLDGRLLESAPPWDYPALAKSALRASQDALDIATGGGERLAALAPFPGRVRAAEGYVPNLAVARARLEPLGVQVFEGNTRSGMPFAEASFDLVLNRHGGYRTAEVARILKSGGVFLTQQVGGHNLADLAALFGVELAYPDNTLAGRVDELEALGFAIRRAEAWRGPVAFADVGALVYFLKAVPWVVQGFDLHRHRRVLEALHEQAEAGRALSFTYERFLLEATKG